MSNAPPPLPPKSPRASRYSWAKPTLADFLVAALMAWLFVFTAAGWNVLLNDADTGWHIRTGQWILAERQVPYRDLFSFTLPNQQWFAWEWGADVVFALLHAWGGLPLLTFASASLLLASALILFRWMLWRGASMLLAFPVLMLCVGASTVHYLARPHVFTLFFLALTLWILDAERQSPTWRLWLLLPITLLWTNLHGGWPALFVFLAVQIAVRFLSGDPAWRRELLAAAACALLTLANPYGILLHSHILEYMGSNWIKEAVEEFQSPRFRSENVLQYEVLLLAGVAASWLAARRGVAGRIEAIYVLLWAHLSLGAVRHVPIFVLTAAPVFVREASAALENTFRGASKTSTASIFAELDRDLRPKFARNSLWVLILPLLLWLSNASRWPQDFPANRFPVATLAVAASELQQARIYTGDQWGDYLIYHLWPATRVFMDGRSDFYGEELGRQALLLETSPAAWNKGLSTWNFSHVLVPPTSPLALRLGDDPAWQVVHRDGVSTLFRRVLTPSSAPSASSFFPGQH